MTQEEIDAMMADVDDNKVNSTGAKPNSEDEMINASDPEFQELENSETKQTGPIDPKMDILYDLQLPISIELGRTNMLIREVLKLRRGSVVEFDKLVSEPVDVLVNDKKIAEGEVVVIDKHFGIRITTLIDAVAGVKKR